MSKNLLLLSSSRVGNTGYLEHALPIISNFLQSSEYTGKPLIFVPFAGVAVGFDNYESTVKQAFQSIGIEINSLHHAEDKAKAIRGSGGVVIGGGNTFALLNSLYQFDILEVIKEAVNSGIPYIGWSAGSNISAPTIRTTNDMPIIEPPSFNALNFLNWQINPHYIDGNPPGHNGETRKQRLEEFLVLNSDKKVIGIPEGTALQLTNEELSYIGDKTGFTFSKNNKKAFSNSQELKDSLA